MMRLRD